MCRRYIFIPETLPHILDIFWHPVGQTSAESCRRRDRRDLRSSIKPETWKRFADGLKQNGFFEGELEGSKRYREKTAMAEVSSRSTRHRVNVLVSTAPTTDTRHLFRVGVFYEREGWFDRCG